MTFPKFMVFLTTGKVKALTNVVIEPILSGVLAEHDIQLAPGSPVVSAFAKRTDLIPAAKAAIESVL
jgi:hypothetical protein